MGLPAGVHQTTTAAEASRLPVSVEQAAAVPLPPDRPGTPPNLHTVSPFAAAAAAATEQVSSCATVIGPPCSSSLLAAVADFAFEQASPSAALAGAAVRQVKSPAAAAAAAVEQVSYHCTSCQSTFFP